MGRFRKILAAVDGSASSKNAFRQACVIARGSKSWLTVLTVVPPFEDVFDPRGVRNDIAAALKREGEKVLSVFQEIADGEGVFIKAVMEEGSPVEKILGAAEYGGYDLVVMGRRGKTRLEMALLGGTASRVIASAPGNVLVVPEQAVFGWGKILVASDGSKCGKNAVERALDLAAQNRSELLACSVVDVTQEFQTTAPGEVDKLLKRARTLLTGIEERAREAGVPVSTYVREGDVSAEVVSLANEGKADLIVVGSHGRKGINRLLMGSVTEKVIGFAKCPVLVVK